MAVSAEVGPLDLVAPSLVERSLGRCPQIKAPVANDVAVASLERLGDLVAHLVAARADPRPDGGRELAPAERLRTRVDDPRQEAAPADVQDREAWARAARPRRSRRTLCGGSPSRSPARPR